MKQSGRTSFLLRFIAWTALSIASLSQSAWSQENLIPDQLPKRFNKPEIRAALQAWAEEWDGRDDNISARTINVNGKDWLQVYFKLNFTFNSLININSQEGAIQLALVKIRIGESLNDLRDAAKPIRVEFVADVTVKDLFSNVQSLDYRYKDQLAEPMDKMVKPIQINLYSADDPFWFNTNNTTYNEKTGKDKPRAFAIRMYNECTISIEDLKGLTHEMITHLVLGNHDAYHEQTSWWQFDKGIDHEHAVHVQCLNAANCLSFTIEPIEVYAGLKGRGFEAPGWNEYAFWDDKHGAAIFPDNKGFKIYYKASPSNPKGSFIFRIYTVNGTKIYEGYYKQSNEDEFSMYRHGINYHSVHQLPKRIDLGFLKTGTYLMNIEFVIQDPLTADEYNTKLLILN